MKKLILLIVLSILIVAGIIAFDFYKKATSPYKGYTGEKKISIPEGAAIAHIIDLLKEEDIIVSKTHFKIYYRLFHRKKTFKSGEYLFNKAMSMEEVVDKLYRGKVILYKITVTEGLTLEEIGKLLEEQHGMDYAQFTNYAEENQLINRLDSKARDLEGYLYPDTYLVPRYITAAEFVDLMVRKFKSKFTPKLQWRARDINFSVRDTIILASLIEKETSSREERFLISSVFHNRLRIGMALACDPTIIYALKKADKYQGKLGWKELTFDSPYNTRLYRGLPPGPICNPGFDSIEAALYPASSPYLYFVAMDEKNHYFSKTLSEHNRAVKKYIIDKK